MILYKDYLNHTGSPAQLGCHLTDNTLMLGFGCGIHPSQLDICCFELDRPLTEVYCSAVRSLQKTVGFGVVPSQPTSPYPRPLQEIHWTF